MADIWDRIGIKPPELDPNKVKLILEDAPKAAPKQLSNQTPQSNFDKNLASDGILPSITRGIATTGGRTLSYLNAGAEALGFDPVYDPKELDSKLTYLEQIKERNSQEGITPMRKREIEGIKQEVAKAQGWDAAVPILKQFGDTLTHPSEWTVQGAVESFSPSDPLNIAGFGLGSVAGKPFKSMIGKAIAGGVGGGVEGAIIGGGGEYASALGRGKSEEEAQKAAIGGTVGGAATGGVIGSVAGALTKTPEVVPTQEEYNAYISGIMNGWAGTSQTPKAAGAAASTDPRIENKIYLPNSNQGEGAADPALLTYQEQKQIPYSNDIKQIPHNGTIITGNDGWSTPLGNRIQEAIDAQTGNILHDKLNGVIDTEVSARSNDMLIGWAGKREEDVRSEAVEVQAQIQNLLTNGMDPKSINATLDNMITPTRDDIAITNLLNGSTPLPSRLSGVRLIPLIENSIRTAQEAPQIARTNQEFYEVLTSQGVSKDLANVMTSSYAAKDPQILRDHIYQTLSQNAPALIDHNAIREEVSTQVSGMVAQHEAAKNIETLANDSEVIVENPSKVDEVFSELEFKPSKPSDSSVFFVYKGHEYFVNHHGVMGKVSFLEDGRKWYSYGDIRDDSGLSYMDLQKINDRIYKMKGKEVDNSPIITQADRDLNSELIFVDYAKNSHTFRNDDLDLSKAFKDFWSPVKPQSIEMFMRYVEKNKDKYKNNSETLANDSETIVNIDDFVFNGSKSVGDSNHPSYHRTYAIVSDKDGNQKMLPIDEYEKGDFRNLQDIADRIPFNSPKKKTTAQAEKIKAAQEIPVGGSEDDAKAAVKQVFQKQLDSEYKKMSAAERAALDEQYANAPEDLYGKAIATTNEVYGNDAGSANMALIDARAAAMGISSDEFMQRYGIEINNKTDQDGAQYIKDMEEADAAFQLSEDEINGMVEMGFKSTGEMRSTITLFKTADVSTLPHELFHVFERTLTKEEREAFDYAFRDYKAGDDRSEAGARGWETWLSEGKAPTKALEGVFNKFKTWLRDMWEMVFQSPSNGFKINDQQRAFYRAMMGDKDAIKEVFANAEPSSVEKDPIAAAMYDALPEADTVTKGENTQGTLFGADDGVIVQPKLFSDKTEVDTLKVPDGIKATPQEYRTTVREMANGEALSHPTVAEQIRSSKSYVEAKEEAIIKGDEPSLFGDIPKNETILEDVGEKIGGARKDIWKERGLMISDLANMSASEQSKFVTKDNVMGKPDYVKMANDGIPVERIALYKIMRDRTAAKPSRDTEKGIREYVEAMGVLKGVLDDFLNGKITHKEIQDQMMKRVGYDTSSLPKGYNAKLSPELTEARNKFWAIYKGRSSPLNVSYADNQKIKEMISKGFPSIEPFRRFYDVLNLGVREDGSIKYGLHDHVKGYRRALKDADGKIMEFESKEDAFAKAKELYADRIKRGEDTKPPLPVRPHLDFVKRVGDDVRGGKSVGSDDFMNQYGFRAVEFGNWAAKDERQKVLDHAYDALSDLSSVLNIPEKAISLNGKLAMAFGARGKGGALAHYEPDYVVINMTKMKGAGSLAHEWGHALDHYFGELGRKDTGRVMPRGASGWESKERVDRTNMRPEMKEAFANVMGAIFQSDGAKATVIREYELQLELQLAKEVGKEREYPKSDYLKDRIEKLRNADFVDGNNNKSNYYKEAEGLDAGTKKEYWKQPTELFARAFEAYVYDTLHSNGKRSDYLVQGVGEKLFEEGFRGNPYPAGLERQAINAAFDQLFKTIKNETLEDGNVRLYQTSRAADSIKKIMEEC